MKSKKMPSRKRLLRKIRAETRRIEDYAFYIRKVQAYRKKALARKRKYMMEMEQYYPGEKP